MRHDGCDAGASHAATQRTRMRAARASSHLAAAASGDAVRGRVGLRPSGCCFDARVASAARSRPPALRALPSQMADRRGRGGAALDLARFTSLTCLRLRGGGGDGGATGAESRSSYLEMYKTQKTGAVRASRCAAPRRLALTRGVALQMDAREEQLAVWTCCRLTRHPLGGDDGKADVVRGGARLARSGHPCAHASPCAGHVPARLPVQPRAGAAVPEGVPGGRRADACAGEAHRVAQGPDHAAAGKQQRGRRCASRRGLNGRLSRRDARALRVSSHGCATFASLQASRGC